MSIISRGLAIDVNTAVNVAAIEMYAYKPRFSRRNRGIRFPIWIAATVKHFARHHCTCHRIDSC